MITDLSNTFCFSNRIPRLPGVLQRERLEGASGISSVKTHKRKFKATVSIPDVVEPVKLSSQQINQDLEAEAANIEPVPASAPTPRPLAAWVPELRLQRQLRCQWRKLTGILHLRLARRLESRRLPLPLPLLARAGGEGPGGRVEYNCLPLTWCALLLLHACRDEPGSKRAAFRRGAAAGCRMQQGPKTENQIGIYRDIPSWTQYISSYTSTNEEVYRDIPSYTQLPDAIPSYPELYRSELYRV